MPDYLINGETRDCLELSERALLYGDGLFETVRVRSGQAEYLPRHLARLVAGSSRLRFGSVSWQLLEEEIAALAGQRQQAVLKIILSRGKSARGYRFDPAMQSTRVLALSPLPEPDRAPGRGIRTRVCSTRLALQPALAGIKHLNRLEQVLARAEWNDPAIEEGLMLDSREQLIEGTMSNLFVVRGGSLATANLAQCGVAGIMRSVIIDLARQRGIEVNIEPLTLADAQAAEELFVCNSLIGIRPVSSIDELAEFEIGPVTESLRTALAGWNDHGNSNWYAV